MKWTGVSGLESADEVQLWMQFNRNCFFPFLSQVVPSFSSFVWSQIYFKYYGQLPHFK